MPAPSRVRRVDASLESPPADERFVVSAPPFAEPVSVDAIPSGSGAIAVQEPPFVERVVVATFDATRFQIATPSEYFQDAASLAVQSVPQGESPFVLSPPTFKPRATRAVSSRSRLESPRPSVPRKTSKTSRFQPSPRSVPRSEPSIDEIARTLKIARIATDENANFARLAVSSSTSSVVASSAFFERLRSHSLPVDDDAEKLAFLREPTALEQAKKEAPGWASSLVVHFLLILILAFLATNATPKNAFELVSQPGLSDEFVLDDVFDPETAFDSSDVQFETQNVLSVDSTDVADLPEVSVFDESTAAPLSLPDDTLAVDSLAATESDVLGALGGDDLSGRGADKAAALATGGGSEGSEKSVALALAWLAEHQLKDGSWSFQFERCSNCVGSCSHSGQGSANNAPFAATSMALLPFLAAGNTPTQGKYKKVVAKGLQALLENAKSTDDGLDLRDANSNAAMYSQGLATIALCEAFAMRDVREKSRNPRLGYAAQDAIRFIESCQDPYGGGWRYAPRQAGDASVGGWQIMALKSALMGGLDVDDSTGRLALKFLRETVAFDGESRYGYSNTNDGTAATTSAGLLCRLYLDWRTDNPTALAGADWLLGVGPNLNNPYYNYYATQFLHHIGGERWNRWNSAIRDPLIASQSLEGHERGSWYPANADVHCQTGGRLYATSLNCMILEVYYRHMPLYRKLEGAAQFPLEPPIDDDSPSNETEETAVPQTAAATEEKREEE